ncbi:MAG: EVE domain-containing protein [Pedosphaera sp.]|nr:EVE domain-containing protein [Pedosphaera sp.]
MSKQHWLVKQEPEAYPWSQLLTDGQTAWTGVRNFQARLSLRAMSVGDSVLYYHSVTGKQVVGIATVVREAYPDPTATERDWTAVDIAALETFLHPVSLETLKADAVTGNMPLIRQSRLSVMPLEKAVFDRIVSLSHFVGGK